MIRSAVDVRKEGGQAGDGDILCEQNELRDPVPDFCV